MVRYLPLLLAAQDPVEQVDKASASLERGGLYTICVVEMFFIIALFWALQRAQKEYQGKLLEVVKEQTKVLTHQTVLTEKVEGLFQRLTSLLDKRG